MSPNRCGRHCLAYVTCNKLPLVRIQILSRGSIANGAIERMEWQVGRTIELGNLTDLFLYGNNLNDEIPTELGDLGNLTALILDNNKLTGSIPEELGSMASLEQMWLRNNQLSGEISEELEVHFTLIADRNERRSLGITSNLVFSQWEKVFAIPMATATSIDRIVNHSVILEFDGPSYITNQDRNLQIEEESDRQE